MTLSAHADHLVANAERLIPQSLETAHVSNGRFHISDRKDLLIALTHLTPLRVVEAWIDGMLADPDCLSKINAAHYATRHTYFLAQSIAHIGGAAPDAAPFDPAASRHHHQVPSKLNERDHVDAGRIAMETPEILIAYGAYHALFIGYFDALSHAVGGDPESRLQKAIRFTRDVTDHRIIHDFFAQGPAAFTCLVHADRIAREGGQLGEGREGGTLGDFTLDDFAATNELTRRNGLFQAHMPGRTVVCPFYRLFVGAAGEVTERTDTAPRGARLFNGVRLHALYQHAKRSAEPAILWELKTMLAPAVDEATHTLEDAAERHATRPVVTRASAQPS